jgi:hypothetical protein
MGGSTIPLSLPKPAWQMTKDEIGKAVQYAKYSYEKRGKYDPMVPWFDAHFEAIKRAVDEGKNVPAENLYEYPGLIRNDLNDDQRDVAADRMVDEYRATKSFEKAVEAYRGFGAAPTPAAPTPTVTAQPDGRIAVTGLPAETVKTVRDLLGIKGAIIGANGNAIFPKGTNVKALRESLGVTEPTKPAAAPSAPAAERPLSVGLKAKGGALNTEPVTVRDGVVHIGDDPATDLENGDPVRVPDDASKQDIKDALEKAGTLTNRQRFYNKRNGDPSPEEAQRVEKAIEGRTVLDAARYLVTHGDPAQSEIANKVLAKLVAMEADGVDMKLRIIHQDDAGPKETRSARGRTEFEGTTRAIVWLNGSDMTGRVGVEHETLLHELVHLATSAEIMKVKKGAVTGHVKSVVDLHNVMLAIADHITGRFKNHADELTAFEKDLRDETNNAFTEIDEVLSWAMSSKDAQTYLEGIPYKNSNVSMWTKFVQAIRTALGLKPSADTALSEVLRIGDRLLEPMRVTEFHRPIPLWSTDKKKMYRQEVAGRWSSASGNEYDRIEKHGPDLNGYYGPNGERMTRMVPDVPHTVESLRAGLIKQAAEMKPLLDTGVVKVVTAKQAERVLGEPVTLRDKAFFNPEDSTTYFIADHLRPGDDLKGLIKHEVAVHAYQLGRTSAEFKDILRQVDAMKGAEIEAARKRVPSDTPAEHHTEEVLAYLVQNNPTLGIVKRFVAWFRNAIRAIGWKGPLSVNDLVYMADRAMNGGPVVSRDGKAMRSVIKADGYNIIKDPERQQAANLIARSESGDLRGIRDPKDGSLYVWDAYKATHQDAAETLGIDRNKAERLIFSAKELKDLPPGVFSDEPGYRVTRTALPEPTVGEAKLTHEEFQRAFFSRGEPTHYGELTAEQLRAVTNVVGKPQTVLERAKEFHKNWRKSLEQGVFDQYAPIKEISQKGYIKARMSKGGDSTLEATFLYGPPVLDENGDITVLFDKANKGLNGFASVLSKLDGEHDRFLLWVAAQRAEALKAIGLENLWSHSDIAALKTLDAGKMQNGLSRDAAYATALKEMMAYNNAVLDIAYQRGLISDATRMMYRETPYIPFYRLADENIVNGFTAQAGMVNQHAWKKLSGGTGKLNEDLLANMLQNWSHLITASAGNDATKVTLEEAVRLGIAEEVPSGSPVKGAVVFRENSNTVMKNGVRVADPDQPVRNHERSFVVNDPHLLEAISALGNVVRVPKVLRLFKHYLTLGVTINPAYKTRNLMRDSIQSMALADMSLNPIENIKTGWKLTAKESESRAQMLASGAIIRMGSMLDGQNADMGRELVEKMGVPRDHILDDANKIEKFWKHTVRPAFDAYQEFGDRGEQVNRAALYDQLIKKGMSHGEAAFWARDLMDFSMSGSWTAIRFLTQTVPFMNARLQGLYKLGRSAQADKKRFAVVTGGVVMTSLALLAAYHDDDDWKKREDWDRDNYWWFKAGGKAFYIPKPFEIGAIGTVAERLAEYMTDDEMTGKRFGNQLFTLVNNQLSMNPTPQAIKPLIDLWANKDSFTGKPIETMGMERLKPEDRYKQSTSGVARVLSQLGLPNPTQLAMGEYQQMSPVQIDHLIRAYFSWVGTSATTVLDYGIFRPMEKTERPAMQLQDVFLAGNFVKDLPSGSSRYVTQMYEQAKEIEQAYNSYHAALKTGDTERAASLMESEGEKIRQYHEIERIKRAESKLSERARIIERSAMSPEAKRDALTMIANQRDLLARRVSP